MKIFRLKFLELLICKYPHDLSSYKYCKILQVLCQLFCDKKDVMNMKALLRYIGFYISHLIFAYANTTITMYNMKFRAKKIKFLFLDV